MATKYQFTPGSDPCDVCTSMIGTYPYPPSVPVHPNCDCTVDQLNPDNCQKELRDFNLDDYTYTETLIHEADVVNESNSDIDQEWETALEVFNEYWEHPDLKDKANWQSPSGSVTHTITIPSMSIGRVRITTHAIYRQVFCTAQEWEVCRFPAAPGEDFGHTIKENMVRVVGGGALARIGVSHVDLEFIVEDDMGYQDDDEVPV